MAKQVDPYAPMAIPWEWHLAEIAAHARVTEAALDFAHTLSQELAVARSEVECLRAEIARLKGEP